MTTTANNTTTAQENIMTTTANNTTTAQENIMTTTANNTTTAQQQLRRAINTIERATGEQLSHTERKELAQEMEAHRRWNNTATDQATVAAIYTLSNEQRAALVTIIEAHMKNDSDLLSLLGDGISINQGATIVKSQLDSLKAGDCVGLELATYMRTDMEMTHRDFDYL